MVNFIYCVFIHLQWSSTTVSKAVWSFKVGKLNCHVTHSVHIKSTKTLVYVNLTCLSPSGKDGKVKLSPVHWISALSSMLTSRRAGHHLLWSDASKRAALLPRPIDLNLWAPTSNWVPVHHEWQSGACDWCEVTVTLGRKHRSAHLCVRLNSGVYWRLKAAEIWKMGAVCSNSLWFIYKFWVFLGWFATRLIKIMSHRLVYIFECIIIWPGPNSLIVTVWNIWVYMSNIVCETQGK